MFPLNLLARYLPKSFLDLNPKVPEAKYTYQKQLGQFVHDEFTKGEIAAYPTQDVVMVTNVVLDQYSNLIGAGLAPEEAYGMVLGAYTYRGECCSLLRVLAVAIKFGFAATPAFGTVVATGQFLRLLMERFGELTLAELDESWDKSESSAVEAIARMSNVTHVISDLAHVRGDGTFGINEQMATASVLIDVLNVMDPREYPSASRIAIIWRTVAYLRACSVPPTGLAHIVRFAGRDSLLAVEHLAKNGLMTEAVMEAFVASPKLLTENLVHVLAPAIELHKSQGTRFLPAVANRKRRMEALELKLLGEGEKKEDVSDLDTEIRPPNFDLLADNDIVSSS